MGAIDDVFAARSNAHTGKGPQDDRPFLYGEFKAEHGAHRAWRGESVVALRAPRNAKSSRIVRRNSAISREQGGVNLQGQYDLAVAMRDVGRLVAREVQTAA